MTRRMMLLVVAIVGLMVLVVTVTPPRTPTRGGSQAPGAPASEPEGFDVQATLSAEGDAQPQKIEAELGDNVEIVVEGLRPGSVALGDVRSAVYEEGLPARLALMAETTGAYPLVLVNDGRRIGTLEIR